LISNKESQIGKNKKIKKIRCTQIRVKLDVTTPWNGLRRSRWPCLSWQRVGFPGKGCVLYALILAVTH